MAMRGRGAKWGWVTEIFTNCWQIYEKIGQLVEIHEPVDADLEAAAIQRRVFAAGGPAIFFANVINCRFPMVSNLFGTMERVRYIFRDTLESVSRIVELGVDPSDILRRPRLLLKVPFWAWNAVPRRVRSGPVLACQTTIDQLPQLRSWPMDGGAFITLPQVYTEDPARPGLLNSNMGMYRIQISGGKYVRNLQIGLHYQLHRDIARHHARALELGQPLRVNIFVGGPPAMTVAATMPLPPNVSELSFAGLLAGFRIPMICRPGQLAISAEADFCIVGQIEPNLLLPEGPFGDHLGYYSLIHDFPVIRVEAVYHRRDAVWPFTVVGRPPQEDSNFARLIHELVGPVVPSCGAGSKSGARGGCCRCPSPVPGDRFGKVHSLRRSTPTQTTSHAGLRPFGIRPDFPHEISVHRCPGR